MVLIFLKHLSILLLWLKNNIHQDWSENDPHKQPIFMLVMSGLKSDNLFIQSFTSFPNFFLFDIFFSYSNIIDNLFLICLKSLWGSSEK